MMPAPIRPEEDWSGAHQSALRDFTIVERYESEGLSLDIRRFSWVLPVAGEIVPARHYLDLSLSTPKRLSVLKTDVWKEPHHSGEMLYLPPGRSYWGEPAIEQRNLLCLSFGDTFLRNIFEGDEPLAHAVPCADISSAALRQYLSALARELLSPGFARHAMIDSLAICAVIELSRQAGNRVALNTSGGGNMHARRIKDYVEANLSQSLGIADIGRACGMSTRSVARIFRQAYNQSIGEFIAMSRIERAKNLLAADQSRIKEISWHCGFRNASAFSAAFRAATGLTPRAYRERYIRTGAGAPE